MSYDLEWVLEENLSHSPVMLAERGLGILLRVYSLPILNPTCPGFGGDRLDTLFVTTAFEGLSEAERISQPLAGCVLSIGVYTKGLPLQRFG